MKPNVLGSSAHHRTIACDMRLSFANHSLFMQSAMHEGASYGNDVTIKVYHEAVKLFSAPSPSNPTWLYVRAGPLIYRISSYV